MFEWYSGYLEIPQRLQTYPTSLYSVAYNTSVPPPEQNISLTNVIAIFTEIPNVHHRHYISLLLTLLRVLSTVTHLRSGSCHYAINMYSRTAENDWYSVWGLGFCLPKLLP